MNSDNPLVGMIANITGRVQGVGFRYYTKQEADRLGATGTVQNLVDGSVSIKAFGESDIINSLIEWCKNGPDSSEVKTLEYQFIDFNIMDGFTIIR